MTAKPNIDSKLVAVRDKRACGALLFLLCSLMCAAFSGPQVEPIAGVRLAAGVLALIGAANWITGTAELLTLQERKTVSWWQVLLHRSVELVRFPGLLGE